MNSVETTPWLGKGKVSIGYCYGAQTITGPWSRSYTHMLNYDFYHNKRINGDYGYETSGPGVPAARCEIVKSFLANPERPEWLLQLDTDASFAPNIVDVLLESADPIKAPIVSGLAFRLVHTGPPNAAGGSPFELQPVIYRLRDGEGADYLIDYPKDTLVRCTGVGAHCLLVHRSVYEDPRWRKDGHPHTWFRVAVSPGGNEVSEDFFFSRRATELGFPIHVNTAAKTGHVKHLVLDEDFFEMLNSREKGKVVREALAGGDDASTQYAYVLAENLYLKNVLKAHGIAYEQS